ncbi:hypothetical protein F4556_000134 [Kitasatospora gansuensis]|uniref:Uncharacterized protein n=1 Tax=Kitasatospora gansuensis TaxID=258050 RepID=A0A7W7S653_9ACTN|nr:hypothetical protein [Kitasatospora gansuensis]MBB4944599.1 hypothetical protein [Kitasatospora gansuensis]
MSRGRAARVAGEDLAVAVEESELVKSVSAGADVSAADEALLDSILEGHKARVVTAGGSGPAGWP